MLFLIMALGAITPELRGQALDDRDSICLTPQDLQSTFYFDLGGEGLDKRLGVLRFVLASTSPAATVEQTRGVRVGDNLLRVDLRDLGPGWVKHFAIEIVKQYPYSQHRLPLIIRADWFIQHVMDQTRSGQLYYKFLTGEAVKSKLQFFKAFGVQANSPFEYGTVTQVSGVSVTGVRLITTLPDDHRSSLWQTYDSAKLDGETDPLANLNGKLRFDAQEIIGTISKTSRHTGESGTLQVYGLFDSGGKIQPKAPADAVTDSTRVRGVEVIAPLSCISCHAVGLNPLGNNAVKKYLQSGAEILAAGESETDQRSIGDKYLVNLDRILVRNNEDYARIVRAVTGWSPEELSKNMREEVMSYDRDVTLGGVARELGVSVDQLSATLAGQGELPARAAQLAHGLPIARTVLEDEFETLLEVAK